MPDQTGARPEHEPDADTVRRMRAAHDRAARVLRVRSRPGSREARGWRGRTLGQPVTTAHGPGWLRLAARPAHKPISIFWTGNIDAEHQLPGCIPRPRLRAWHDWTDDHWAYRAELHEHAPGQPLADTAVLTRDPDPPASWWAALRTTLDTIAAVPTRRVAVRPEFLAWAMPRYLGQSVDIAGTSGWTTAHGDLHFGNLFGPDLTILDWEGWGQAPAGYDAATLHCRSLAAPAAAARVRAELGHALATPAGRWAEIVVITELLHAAASHGAHPTLVGPMLERGQLLVPG